MFRKCFRTQKIVKIYLVIVTLVLVVYFKSHILQALVGKQEDFSQLSIYEKQIREYEAHIIHGLGDEGRASYLDDTDKEFGQLSLKILAVNTVLSDRIPLDRSLKDYRHPQCKDISYDVHMNVSVIIIFYNEPISVLLRTVWSIIHRTPHNLLHEIILVDDFSDVDTLGKRLELYISTRLANHPVKLLRSPQRLGLIRARLKGARAATGEVLVFLDAHCETTYQWLEPLVARIESDRTTVVMPIIDVIEADTFFYSTNGHSFQVGGFSWNGHFNWIDVQESEKTRQKSPVDPVRSPTMAGGLFAMDRRYFWEVGSYDEQMDGWGGENLEMSFRVWQCGGQLEVVPCSRVGHVFREFHPYKFPHGKDTHGINTARMALVWMDKYADLVFLYKDNYKNNPIIGDITHRSQLRRKLRCKPFSWFLKTIYPEKFIPTENVQGFGKLKTANNMCVDNLQLPEDTVGPLGLYGCHRKLTPTQMFSLSLSGEIRQEDTCAEATTKNAVQLTKCHGHKGNQEWEYEDGKLKNTFTGLCLSADGELLKMPLQCASVQDQYKKCKDLKPEDVASLMEWAEKQPHLPKMTELEVILFLHSCNYSQEAAKVTIDNFYTCRTHCPEFFANRIPNSMLQNALNVGIYYILPGSTKEGHQVIYCALADADPNKYVFTEQLKLFTMVIDTWLLREGTVPGHVIVFDMEGVVFGHLTKLGIMTMKKYMYYLQEAMPVRLKGLHFINVVSFMDKILAIMKPFMKKELMDVLYLHTEGMDSFQKFVPQKNLPKELNGKGPTRKEMHDFMVTDIKSNAEFFRDEESQRVDETRRPGKAKNAGDLFGVEGTFKKLDID